MNAETWPQLLISSDAIESERRGSCEQRACCNVPSFSQMEVLVLHYKLLRLGRTVEA
jgi:hypothetical protein